MRKNWANTDRDRYLKKLTTTPRLGGSTAEDPRAAMRTLSDASGTARGGAICGAGGGAWRRRGPARAASAPLAGVGRRCRRLLAPRGQKMGLGWGRTKADLVEQLIAQLLLRCGKKEDF